MTQEDLETTVTLEVQRLRLSILELQLKAATLRDEGRVSQETCLAFLHTSGLLMTALLDPTLKNL